jgi:predicted DNA-binding transcriptional regulator YafY
VSSAAEKVHRVWSVFEALRSRRRGLRVAEIVELTAIPRSSLYRYLEVLEAAGVPMVTERVNGEVRYRLIEEALPRYALRPDELAALALAREALEPLEGTRVVETLDTLLRRLGRPRGAPSWISLPEPPSDPDKAALRAIDLAIREGHRLAFDYRAADDAHPARRLADPVAVRLHRGYAYLVAFDVDRDAWRIFKLARITGDLELAGEAEPRPDYDEDALFAHSAGIWTGEPIDVAIELSARVAPRAAEYPLTRDQKLSPTGDGGVLVRARVAGLEETLRWLLSWGADSHPLEPAELRELHQRELEAALGGYTNTAPDDADR